MIIFNVVIMMLEHHDMDPEFWQLLEHMNFGCLVFFTVEMVPHLLDFLLPCTTPLSSSFYRPSRPHDAKVPGGSVRCY